MNFGIREDRAQVLIVTVHGTMEPTISAQMQSPLCYLPTLFGYLTGTDFLQHPWYKNGGIGVAYTWLPGSLSAGFGDGHEKRNGKPYASGALLPISWPVLPVTRMQPGILLSTTGMIPSLKPVSTVSHPPSSARPIVNFRRMRRAYGLGTVAK